MSFKDMVKRDVKNIFLDLDTFGESHIVDGREMTIIIDENELTEREKKMKTLAEGLHKKQLLIYVSEDDFGPEPLIGRLLELDGSYYIVTDVVNESGMYSISLEVRES